MILELDDYKLFLNINSVITEYDTILTEIIEGIETGVQNFIRYDLITAEHTEYLGGKGSVNLFTEHVPVTAVGSISYWDGEDWADLVESVDYERLLILKESIIYLGGYVFTKGTANFKIVYTAGYADADSIPKPIVMAMKRLVKLRWDETPMGMNSLGKLSVNNSGGIQSSINLDKNAENEIYKSIEVYAHVNV